MPGPCSFRPRFPQGGVWIEKRGGVRAASHSPEELLRAMARPNAPVA